MNRRGPIIVAAAGAVVAVLISVLLILPKMHAVSDTQSQVTAERAKTAQLNNKVAELKGLAAQADKLRAELKKFDIQVPPTADLPGLIRELSANAKTSGVDFFSVAPAQPTTLTSPTVSEIPLAITVNGQYFSVEEFLYHLETSSRTAEIQSVNLTPSTNAGSTSSSTTTSTGGPPTKAPELAAVITVNFFTVDTSAGPGSQFGSQQGSSSSSSTSSSGTTTTTTTSSSSSSSSS